MCSPPPRTAGNPVAVVLDGDGPDDRADAAVRELDEPVGDHVRAAARGPPARITGCGSSPRPRELPFAGHPTLGTCHAWLGAGGTPRAGGRDRAGMPGGPGAGPAQRGRAGLRGAAGAAGRPARRRTCWRRWRRRCGSTGPPSWTRPGRTTARAGSRCCWTAPRRCWPSSPADTDLDLGLAGPYPAGSPAAFEVRAFFTKDGGIAEDPVTGSLNASLAAWLLRTGRASRAVRGQPGHGAGPAGRVGISRDADGTIWVARRHRHLRVRPGRPVARSRPLTMPAHPSGPGLARLAADPPGRFPAAVTGAAPTMIAERDS